MNWSWDLRANGKIWRKSALDERVTKVIVEQPWLGSVNYDENYDETYDETYEERIKMRIMV